MPCTAKQIIKLAKSQRGYHESPSGSNKTKYGKEYGMNGTPWCAIFVWWCFKHAGASELFFGGKKTAYVPALADYYIAHKRIVKKTHGKAGDIVFFDFDHNGNSDHVGFIYKKKDSNHYYTIEGNTGTTNQANGGEVMLRCRSLDQISRIARPKYLKPKKVIKKGKADTKKYPLLKKGSKGKYVKLLQKLLKVKADGIFGDKTEKAVKKFQKKHKLKVDGQVGAKTWKLLLK